MSLLDDFKKAIGETGTSNDDYYISAFIRQALDRATELTVNHRVTEVTLTDGTYEYDLTSSSIASPVVPASGIESIIIDDDQMLEYNVNEDFYVKDLTKLYFPEPEDIGGTFKFKYNLYYSTPTVDGETYTETDAPTRLLPHIKDYAKVLYQIEQVEVGNASGGIEEKQESNVRTKYGSVDTRTKVLYARLNAIERRIKQSGIGKRGFYQVQVI